MGRYAAGPYGKKVLYFDGVDDYVEVPHSDSLWLEEFTVELLVKAQPGGGYGRLIEKGGCEDPEGGFGIEDLEDGYCNFLVWDSGRCYGFRPLGYRVLDGTLRHVIFMYRNLHIWVYIDGALKGEKDVESYRPTTNRLTLMRRSVESGNYHSGLLMVVRIYSRVLSEREIRTLKNDAFNLRPASVRDGLVLELIPDTLDCEAGKWYDNSGHGNHGTIHGARCVWI